MQPPSQGAAKIIYEGVRDASGRVINLSPTVSPSHVPLVFLLSDKSYDEPKYLSPTQLTRVLGSQTLNKLSKFYSHQSLLTDIVAKNGSPVLYYPVKVPGRTKAKIRLSVSILQPLPDGDSQPPGRLVWTDNLSGYPEDLQNYTAGDVYPSDLASTATYPILDAELSYYGESGNKVGFVLEAVSLDEMTNLMLPRRAAVYKFGLIEISPTGATVPILTVNGEDKVFVTLTKDVVDATNTSLYLPHVFDRHYFHGAGNTLENFGEFEAIYVYDDVISKLLTRLYDLEVGYDDAIPSGFREDWELGSDVANQVYLNIVSGKHIDGLTNYQGFGVDRQGLVGTGNKVLAQGGSSGIPELRSQREKFIQANTLLDTYVTDLGSSMTEDSIFADGARFDYTLMYDSGFAMSAKEALTNLLTSRSDVMLIMTPHSYGEINYLPDAGQPSVFGFIPLNDAINARILNDLETYWTEQGYDSNQYLFPHKCRVENISVTAEHAEWVVHQYFYQDAGVSKNAFHWLNATAPWENINAANQQGSFTLSQAQYQKVTDDRPVVNFDMSAQEIIDDITFVSNQRLVVNSVFIDHVQMLNESGEGHLVEWNYTNDFDGAGNAWVSGTNKVSNKFWYVVEPEALLAYREATPTASQVTFSVAVNQADKLDLVDGGQRIKLSQLIALLADNPTDSIQVDTINGRYHITVRWSSDSPEDVLFGEIRGNGYGVLDQQLISIDATVSPHVILLDKNNLPVDGIGVKQGFRLVFGLKQAEQISCEGATDTSNCMSLNGNFKVDIDGVDIEQVMTGQEVYDYFRNHPDFEVIDCANPDSLPFISYTTYTDNSQEPS